MSPQEVSAWQQFLADIRNPKTFSRCIYCQHSQRCPWGCRWPKQEENGK